MRGMRVVVLGDRELVEALQPREEIDQRFAAYSVAVSVQKGRCFNWAVDQLTIVLSNVQAQSNSLDFAKILS